jgi:hypothetical protein
MDGCREGPFVGWGDGCDEGCSDGCLGNVYRDSMCDINE